jgi:hypothetical protein
MYKEENKKPRKAYAKPCIAIENFTMNQFIANCSISVKHSGWKETLMEKDYFTYLAVIRTNQFNENKLICANDADAYTDDMDTLCYHTATSPLVTS